MIQICLNAMLIKIYWNPDITKLYTYIFFFTGKQKLSSNFNTDIKNSKTAFIKIFSPLNITIETLKLNMHNQNLPFSVNLQK